MENLSIIDRLSNYLIEASKKPTRLAEGMDALARQNQKKQGSADRDAGSSSMSNGVGSIDCSGDSGGCD